MNSKALNIINIINLTQGEILENKDGLQYVYLGKFMLLNDWCLVVLHKKVHDQEKPFTGLHIIEYTQLIFNYRELGFITTREKVKI